MEQILGDVAARLMPLDIGFIRYGKSEPRERLAIGEADSVTGPAPAKKVARFRFTAKIDGEVKLQAGKPFLETLFFLLFQFLLRL